jgi:transposase
LGGAPRSLLDGQAAAPARAVAAKGAADPPEGGSGGAGGVRKGGLQAALDAACAAHPEHRLTLWFQDEARLGQKGRVCHRWFTRGVRPSGLCDQRYTWAHVFAAVRPATGEDFALVLPHVSTAAMSEFLKRFAATLDRDEHAALVLDGAGWHTANDLTVPENVTLVPLPPYSPELNPVERVWLYLRERHLSHRLLDDYEQVVEALCSAWKALTPDRLRSLTDFAYLRQVRI